MQGRQQDCEFSQQFFKAQIYTEKRVEDKVMERRVPTLLCS